MTDGAGIPICAGRGLCRLRLREEVRRYGSRKRRRGGGPKEITTVGGAHLPLLPPRLYNLRLTQLLDLAFAVAQLGEHLGGVLAQLRRRRRDVSRRAREPDRLVDDSQFPEFPALHFRRRLDVLHL